MNKTTNKATELNDWTMYIYICIYIRCTKYDNRQSTKKIN